ncbi:hypothetical protein DM01DRAFT_328765 [Hesseltinella vesiculosa]|uniref:Uncharacterized protein n=1 Tax=Hesseltinella vesiculosa TaxID=101127 RepID=A0A1X2GDT3_9FUNG|nr:hypothetical protein DM01DRAFT_328765 [Hesseltinella vesiculosa]
MSDNKRPYAKLLEIYMESNRRHEERLAQQAGVPSSPVASAGASVGAAAPPPGPSGPSPLGSGPSGPPGSSSGFSGSAANAATGYKQRQLQWKQQLQHKQVIVMQQKPQHAAMSNHLQPNLQSCSSSDIPMLVWSVFKPWNSSSANSTSSSGSQ